MVDPGPVPAGSGPIGIPTSIAVLINTNDRPLCFVWNGPSHCYTTSGTTLVTLLTLLYDVAWYIVQSNIQMRNEFSGQAVVH